MIFVVVLCGFGVGGGVALLIGGLFSTTPRAQRMSFAAQIDPATRRSATAALILGIVVGLITHWPVGIAIGVGVGWTLSSALAPNSGRQMIGRLEGLATWIETLRDSVASHRGLVGAIESTVGSAQGTLRPHIEALVVRIRTGVPLDMAFTALAVDLGDAAADEAIAPLIVAARHGSSDLQNLLSHAAQNTREQVGLWRRTELARSKPRREMRVVLLVTIGFCLLAFTAGHSYMAPFGTISGQIAVVVIAGLFVGGFATMNRLSKPQPMPRLFSKTNRPTDLEAKAGR